MGYAHTMESRRHLARLTAAVVLLVGGGFIVGASASPVHAVACATTMCGGGEFHPLNPARIFDSRPASAINDVAPGGAKPLGSPDPATFDIALLGQGGIPTTNVLAVVVNLTVTEPGANGYLEAYGAGARPVERTSIVNFAPGQTIPNVAIVRPGTDGKLSIGLFGQRGTANVVVDVFGWFSTSDYTAGDGARLIPTPPSRILDTRTGSNVHRDPAAPLGTGETMTLPILGQNGIPSTGVTGVLLNVVGVTTEPGAAATFLSLFPNDLPAGTAPTTSNLNLVVGNIKANLVFVPVGSDGQVRIFNHQGLTQVVADVVGYMQTGQPEATRKGRVVPLASPYRALDTRSALFGSAALGPGQSEDWSFADFASSVSIGAEAVGAQLAVIGNLTSASLARQYPSVPVRSFLTAYPGGTQLPLASTLNTVEGPPTPNMAVLTYGTDNTENVYNNAGSAHYIFDASAVVLSD